MKKKTTLVIVLCLLMVLVGAASILYDEYGPEAKPESPDVKPVPADPTKTWAPDFVAYDIEGNEVSLSDYFGKPIVLNFWASWCDPCKAEMPLFETKYNEIGDEVQFLMVNRTNGYRESFAAALDFLDSTGYTFPVLYDMEGSAGYAYAAYAIPLTFFIDEDGTIAGKYAGSMSEEVFEEKLALIY